MSLLTSETDGKAAPRDGRIAIALAAFTFLVYCSTVTHTFIDYDDGGYVVGHPVVSRGLAAEGIRWALTPNPPCYHPITWLSHMLDMSVFGAHAWGPKLINVTIHALTTGLLYLVLRRLTGAVWACAVVAFFFGVHPLRVEHVAWVFGRKDVLALFFAVLTVGAYERYARLGGVKNYLATLGLFLCSLASKPTLVVLPCVLMLLDYWPLRRLPWSPPPGAGDPPAAPARGWGRVMVEKIPFFALSALFSYLAVVTIDAANALLPSGKLPAGLRAINTLANYGWYLRVLFRPVDLAVIYPLHAHELSEAVIAGVVLAAVTAGAVYLARRKPYVIVGWLWFLGCLFPVSGVVPQGSHEVADRYSTLPHLGLLVALVWAGRDAWRALDARRQRAAAAVVVIAASVSAVMTVLQVQYWRDTLTLFRHADSVTENNMVAMLFIGIHESKRGNYPEATEAFRRVLALKPGDEIARSGVASAERLWAGELAKAGRIDEAAAAIARALEIEPNDPYARFNLGMMRARQGRLEDAAAQLRAALAIKPDLEPARRLLDQIAPGGR